MKIGFDAKRAFNNTTGLGNYSRFIIEALGKYCAENQYFTYTPKMNDSLFKHHNTITPPHVFHSYWRTVGIVNDLKRDGILLYHGLSNELPLGLAKANIRAVVTIHDLIFVRYPKLYPAIDRFFYYRKCKSACQNADVIVAVSEQTKRDIIEFFKVNPQKIKVVYQDCDVAFQRRVGEEAILTVKQKYNLDRRYMLSVGTIEERKNQLRLVQSFYEANLKDATLVLVGRATKYQQQIEAFIQQKQLQHKVRILNHAPFADLPALYQGAKLFAYLSVFEGFGIPIVEALHSQTPVLAATGSCLEEAGGGGAIYASPLDKNDIAEKMSQLWNDDNLQKKLIVAGTKHVQQFSGQNIAQELVTLYRSVL
jgi:glycosyltransferase involved in cell wall biosynthesis